MGSRPGCARLCPAVSRRGSAGRPLRALSGAARSLPLPLSGPLSSLGKLLLSNFPRAPGVDAARIAEADCVNGRVWLRGRGASLHPQGTTTGPNDASHLVNDQMNIRHFHFRRVPVYGKGSALDSECKKGAQKRKMKTSSPVAKTEPGFRQEAPMENAMLFFHDPPGKTRFRFWSFPPLVLAMSFATQRMWESAVRSGPCGTGRQRRYRGLPTLAQATLYSDCGWLMLGGLTARPGSTAGGDLLAASTGPLFGRAVHLRATFPVQNVRCREHVL